MNRLTPDFVMPPHRMPTPEEYRLSLRILNDFAKGRGSKWRMRDLTDMEHDVLMSLYRAGILEQSRYTLEHRLTPYGEVYLAQRQKPARDAKRSALPVLLKDVDGRTIRRFRTRQEALRYGKAYVARTGKYARIESPGSGRERTHMVKTRRQ